MNNYVYAACEDRVTLTTLADTEPEAARLIRERITHLRDHAGVSLPEFADFELISIYPAPFWAETKKQLDK